MIQINELILTLSPMKFEIPNFKKDSYAQSIPYESLYQKNDKPNKNIMEYNTLKMNELIREQNEKIIKEIFSKP